MDRKDVDAGDEDGSNVLYVIFFSSFSLLIWNILQFHMKCNETKLSHYDYFHNMGMDHIRYKSNDFSS